MARASSATGLGVDVVDIEDFSATLRRSGRRFITEVFTDAEIAYCDGRRPQHYCVRWAAKEAFFKASAAVQSLAPGHENESWTLMGGLPHDFQYRDIEVITSTGRAPALRLAGAAARWSRAVGLAWAVVSLSHSRSTAFAAVVLQFEPARKTQKLAEPKSIAIKPLTTKENRS